MCLDIIYIFVEFQIHHVPRHENYKANILAQQAFGYDVGGRNFHIKEKMMQEKFASLYAGTVESAQPTPELAQPTQEPA
jgi:hypothetical protein